MFLVVENFRVLRFAGKPATGIRLCGRQDRSHTEGHRDSQGGRGFIIGPTLPQAHKPRRLALAGLFYGLYPKQHRNKTVAYAVAYSGFMVVLVGSENSVTSGKLARPERLELPTF